ncbi:hypothetical protein [Staphylococcus phage vB_SauM-V1SA22]|nr:hypothetical protein [Staphylococcus phage vB_SauM-V1SA22]
MLFFCLNKKFSQFIISLYNYSITVIYNCQYLYAYFF